MIVWRVLVTGGRDWDDEALVEWRFRRLPPRSLVVHGGARGLDRIADAVARRLGHSVERHPADWTAHGRAAGIIRNAEMVALGAGECLAFPGPASRGTWDCVDRAYAAGIFVEVLGPWGRR